MSEGARLDPASLRLVVVTDSLRDGIDGLVGRVADAVAGGATMVLLRLHDEGARTLAEVARRLLPAVPGVPVLVDGRADVALATGLHGVHLGVEDLSPAVLRRVVPPAFIIGASVLDAAHAESMGAADYLAVGPVFAPASGHAATPRVGLAGLGEVVARSVRPVVAVGGITEENAASAVGAGAAGVAVISAIFRDPDPRRRARAFRDVLDASGR